MHPETEFRLFAAHKSERLFSKDKEPLLFTSECNQLLVILPESGFTLLYKKAVSSAESMHKNRQIPADRTMSEGKVFSSSRNSVSKKTSESGR